ncbi:hypothetical protein N9917_02385 [Deltaproteobacteria bacterium]|nr:hypothetical protein [Deltaproteobacteria bacterium]
MPTIPQLTATDTVTGSDLIAVWAQSNGDARKAAMSVLLAYMQANLTFTENTGIQKSVTQYSTPTGTGFSVALTDASDNVWLVLTPLAGYAAGTLVLPSVTSAIDQQEVLISSTQAVTALTIDQNGATAVVGAPVALAASGFFRLRYEGPTKTWYRVG